MKVVYLVLVTRREQLKTTTRNMGTQPDSAFSDYEEAKARAAQVSTPHAERRPYEVYKDASVRTVFLDPGSTSTGTGFNAGYDAGEPTRWENGFKVEV